MKKVTVFEILIIDKVGYEKPIRGSYLKEARLLFAQGEPFQDDKHLLEGRDVAKAFNKVGNHDAPEGNFEHGNATGELLFGGLERSGLAKIGEGDIQESGGSFDDESSIGASGLLIHKFSDLGELFLRDVLFETHSVTGGLNIEDKTVAKTGEKIAHLFGEYGSLGRDWLAHLFAVEFEDLAFFGDQMRVISTDLEDVVFRLSGNQNDLVAEGLEEILGLFAEFFTGAGNGAIDI